MAKNRLQNINGHFVESDYENALISYLEAEQWSYVYGDSIPRDSRKEVLYLDDLLQYLKKTYPELDDDEIRQVADNIRLVGADSDFATLHKVYGWLSNGLQFRTKSSSAKMIQLIDFENPYNNLFKVVNQFSVEYINNGETKARRPDVLLYVNGIPVCVIELKNPADAHATILDAWEQINIRYWRDIPSLLHYCPLACISDGVKTRLGTVRTPYEHFYAWRRVEDGDKVSTMPFD
jgi:type I restriction enzyme R subunit